ncbi:TetR/AcrR family transcriptional regulator C-terminal domain-containing protein [Streptomyces sp. NPDC086554]|uniref:TetR/AcrR family transcriptional regulator C-terminal domain-containing protein n=1 Tax=Streptomyces sp. NPDC086554 TaxID=3154864 RepID=UPI003417EF0F
MPVLSAELIAREAAEVIEGVRRLIVEEMDVSAFDTPPWPDALAAWARSYLDAFARHPNSIDLLATTTISSPATLTMYEAVVAALARGGWPQERLVATLTSPVLAAAVESAVGGGKAGRADEAFASGLDALIRGLVAQLAQVRGE